MATKVNVYKKDLGHHMSDIFVDIVTEATSEISYQQVTITGLPEGKRAILREASPSIIPFGKRYFRTRIRSSKPIATLLSPPGVTILQIARRNSVA